VEDRTRARESADNHDFALPAPNPSSNGHASITDAQFTADRTELARWSGERQGELISAAAGQLGPDAGMRDLTHAAADLARVGVR
jgi:hypothetical protein